MGLRRFNMLTVHTELYRNYADPKDLLEAYYRYEVTLKALITCFDECDVDYVKDELTGLVALLEI
jgi:hypothetical protein